jgi:hypothetical protein
MEHATRYPHPSNAHQAANAYRAKAEKIWPCPPVCLVYDSSDPERGWVE